MQISDLLGHYMTSAGSQSEPITKKKGVERLASPMSELTKGNVFEGTVTSVKGKQVVLGLSNGKQIMARLDGKVSLEPGQSMFFQVKSSEGNTIAIRPFTVDGAGANLTLLEALKSAGLPTDAGHLEMVNKMMEEQMPIDRNSLNQMARLMQSNGDIDVKTLVQLKKLELPMTIEFATQFENYQADKQAIHGALNEFMDALPDSLANQNLSATELTQMGSDILSIVTENLSELVEVPEGYVESAETFEGVNTEGISVEGEIVVEGENGPEVKLEILSQTESVEEKAIFKDSNNVQSGSVDVKERNPLENIQHNFDMETETLVEQKGENSLKEAQNTVLAGNDDPEKMMKELKQTSVLPNTLGSIMSEEQQQYLKGQLQVLFSAGDQLYDASKLGKNTSVISVLNDINELLSNNPQLNKDVLLEFFSGNEFKAMVRDALEQQWTIKPKDLEGADKINGLYDKLENQLTRMEAVVKATGQQENQVTQLADNIRDNVDFMKQINEAYTYVQIPLKMSGQNASGQLYVYTNKKKLEKGDEDLTAFLHLDMDNLGATDVAVRMHGKDVTTNFYMESDESYELLKKFMPQLEKKLNDKGYNCKLIVNNETKKVNFVDDFLKRDQPAAGQVRRYSFDMRA